VCKAGRALLLQPLVALGEHLLERRDPLPEINVRIVGHQFVPPHCTRRYASPPGSRHSRSPTHSTTSIFSLPLRSTNPSERPCARLRNCDQRLQFGEDGLRRMFFGIGGEPDDVAEQHRHVLIALRCEPAVELQSAGDK
jgi:hypothetical protein